MAGLDDLSLEQLQAEQQRRASVAASQQSGSMAPVDAIHTIESGSASDARADIVNPASGAQGSMQVMPTTQTAPGFGVKPSNGTPEDTARAGRDYYAAMQEKYKDPQIAAVAYNWGPGNADKWLANGGRLDDLPLETLKYVQQFRAHTGIGQSQQSATPAQQAAFGSQDQAAQQPAPQPALTGNDLLRKQLGIDNPITDRQKAAAAVYGGLEGGPLNEFTHGIASGAANLVGGAGQLVQRGIGAGLNALGFPNAGAYVSGSGDADARFFNQGTPDSVAGQVGQVVGSAALPAAGGGVVRGIVGGAAGGAAQPVLDGQDYWSQKAQQAGIGAAVGGAAGALGKVISGANVSPNVRRLMDAGVTPTPGQVLGGAAKTMEDKLASFPVAGEAIASGQRSAIKDMNRALYQDVLDPIGERAPTAVGRDSIDAVGDRLSDRYNNLLPNVTFHVDNQFMQDMGAAVKKVDKLAPDLKNYFNGTIDDNLLSQLQNGQMGGVELKKVESILGQEANKFRYSPDPFHRDLGQAIGDVQTAVRQSLLRSNPQHAQELQAINSAYSRFAILRNAASKVNDPSKPIMPGQLQEAVKQGDKSIGKGAFARGNARGQGMSDAAMEVLGSKYPDSGTASRLLLGGGLLGGNLLTPHFGVPAAVASALYGTNLGRQAMLAAIVRRPDVVRQVGRGISNVSPLAGVAAAGLLSGKSGQ